VLELIRSAFVSPPNVIMLNVIPTVNVIKKKTLKNFAPKFSNIDFFLRLLPLEHDEYSYYKKWGVTDFVLERTWPTEHPKSIKKKIGFR